MSMIDVTVIGNFIGKMVNYNGLVTTIMLNKLVVGIGMIVMII
jgi:hypothetical protein